MATTLVKSQQLLHKFSLPGFLSSGGATSSSSAHPHPHPHPHHHNHRPPPATSNSPPHLLTTLAASPSEQLLPPEGSTTITRPGAARARAARRRGRSQVEAVESVAKAGGESSAALVEEWRVVSQCRVRCVRRGQGELRRVTAAEIHAVTRSDEHSDFLSKTSE
ncbi:hypothetical protein NL676_039154 [Syzygium grande]|nr:hypothetical protein NL676_039154 [Syzygium grande]